MDPDNVASGAFVSLLHFTRGTFFLLSAFVLTYALGSKPVEVRRFWPRRFLYVGVPYVVWTVIYWWIALGRLPGVDDLGQLGHELLTGTGNYHLYFLLVSLQLYLLFPLLVWLVRRTRGHHRALFLVSGALELVLLALTHYATWPGSWATVQANALVLAPTYQFYFVAGALAAVHHDRFHAWVVGRPRAVVGALVVTAALHVGVYLVRLRSGRLAGSGSFFRSFGPNYAPDSHRPGARARCPESVAAVSATSTIQQQSIWMRYPLPAGSLISSRLMKRWSVEIWLQRLPTGRMRARDASANTSGWTSASWNTTSARSRMRAARNVRRSGAPGPAPTR